MTVILGYDDSPGAARALEVAIAMAQRWQEPLVLVYGVAPPGRLGEEFHEHLEAVTELARQATASALQTALAAGVDTSVELVAAKPVDALIQVADEHEATVIVVGTASESPIRGAILGSTPHKLLHLSTRPVLCVPVL